MHAGSNLPACTFFQLDIFSECLRIRCFKNGSKADMRRIAPAIQYHFVSPLAVP